MARNRKNLTMNTICTSANEVARYLISRQGEEGMNAHTLTNMRLQKILYYAQGFMLGRKGVPLFADPFHALPYGPVCLDIYGMLKQYGRGPIPIREGKRNLVPRDPDFEAGYVQEYLDYIMQWANNFTTWQLVLRSHVEGGPWANVWSRGTLGYDEIPQTMMASYFGQFFAR